MRTIGLSGKVMVNQTIILKGTNRWLTASMTFSNTLMQSGGEDFLRELTQFMLNYISIMPKPDGLTAVKNLAEAFEHYNEWHPHSALGYRSPREYLRHRTRNGLSDKRCPRIQIISATLGHVDGGTVSYR